MKRLLPPILLLVLLGLSVLRAEASPACPFPSNTSRDSAIAFVPDSTSPYRTMSGPAALPDSVPTGIPDLIAPGLIHPVYSTRDQATALLDSVQLPDSSRWWPNVRKRLFLENLKANIQRPLAIYQGTNTNFCGYAAMSYLPLQEDPVKYTRFMLDLYLNGKADWGKVHFRPSSEVRKAAGTLRFKGILDIRPGDQMWFLILADHFRSYLNFFNRRFHPGAEDTFWAAVNYGKFNRMIREMAGYTVEATGSDILRPHFKDLYAYLIARLSTGVTYLYVNNVYLHKKAHDTNKFRNSFPTHFIVLTDIHRIPGEEGKDMVDIIYWDYGGRTLRQVDLRFLKKIIFGVSHCTPPSSSQTAVK